MKHASVLAREDIRTDKGLVVARKRELGLAIAGARPSLPAHWGRVLVRWRGHKHTYWCRPEDLKFENGGAHLYVAVRAVFDLYGDKPALPEIQSVSLPCYHYGENLRFIRCSRRVSQVELGERMRCHGCPARQSTISHRERCRYSPTGPFVEAAAKALGLPPFVFFLPLQSCQALREGIAALGGVRTHLCKE